MVAPGHRYVVPPEPLSRHGLGLRAGRSSLRHSFQGCATRALALLEEAHCCRRIVLARESSLEPSFSSFRAVAGPPFFLSSAHKRRNAYTFASALSSPSGVASARGA